MEYKAVIFFTYCFYTSVKGLELRLPNSIFLATAHDESALYRPLYKKIFNLPKAFLYNSIEERELIYKTFKTQGKISRLTCIGISEPDCNSVSFPNRFNEIQDNYILYLGRINSGKGYCELNRYFIDYKRRNPSDLKLLVVGKFDNGVKVTISDDIIYAGFVTDDERNIILSNAKILINPSKYESLSLSILESMIARTPILVNGNCDVLKGQCIRSNAGLYYTNYMEFEYGLNFILNNEEAYREMCENGYKFVKENYDWDTVVENVTSLIYEINYEPKENN
jgi:glycosyltransferase involved in cell wall biosynthesis